MCEFRSVSSSEAEADAEAEAEVEEVQREKAEVEKAEDEKAEEGLETLLNLLGGAAARGVGKHSLEKALLLRSCPPTLDPPTLTFADI